MNTLPFATDVAPSPADIVTVAVGPAEEVAARIRAGCRVFGFTKGQFSLLDLVKAVGLKTGPVHLTISTWTAGSRDTENVGMLRDQGLFLSLRLLVDRSFATRQAQYCETVRRVFGDEAIRCTRTHAKFALLRNDTWNVVIRSSMNLNRNPRFEQFDIDDDPVLADFLQAHCDEMSETMPAGLAQPTRVVDAAFVASMGGGLSGAYAAEDIAELKRAAKELKASVRRSVFG